MNLETPRLDKRNQDTPAESGDSKPDNEAEKSGRDISRRVFLNTVGQILVGGSLAEALEQRRKSQVKKKTETVARKPRTRPELLGTPRSLDRQNLIALVDDLTPISDARELERFVRARPPLMVPLPENSVFAVAPNLAKEDRSFCLPWTAHFLNILGNEWAKKFPKKHLNISSSIRPRYLGKINRNASVRSTHPTGNTVDISYIWMTPEEDRWMQNYLALWEHSTFSATINMHSLNDNQREWYRKLTRSQKKSILSSQDRSGNVLLHLPKVEATREVAQKCFHFAVAKVAPFLK